MKKLYFLLPATFFLFSHTLTCAAKCFKPTKHPFSQVQEGDEVIYQQLSSVKGFPTFSKRAGVVVSQLSSDENENTFSIKEINYTPNDMIIWRANRTGDGLEISDGTWRVSSEYGIYKKTDCVIVHRKRYRQGSKLSVHFGKRMRPTILRALKVYENGMALVGRMSDQRDAYSDYHRLGNQLFKEKKISLKIVALKKRKKRLLR